MALTALTPRRDESTGELHAETRPNGNTAVSLAYRQQCEKRLGVFATYARSSCSTWAQRRRQKPRARDRRLLVAQRLHRFHARGAACREITGERSTGEQNQAHG
jgi:hypothetical protein